MKSRQIAPTLAALALCSLSLTSHAAQQCLTRGPGTYGAVSVTGCDDDQANGIFNPFLATTTGQGLSYDGIALQAPGTNPVCNLTFSRPIATSSLRLSLDGHQTYDALTISTNGNVYTPVPADISPLPGGVSPNALVISGNSIVGDGSFRDNPNEPRGAGSSGIVQLTNNAPAALTSLTLDEAISWDGGTLIGVCFDDAPIPAEPTPVPTQSTAALAGLALVASLLGGWQLRRRSRRSRPADRA